MPDAGAGRRVPAAVRAAAGARPGRAGDDRRDGRAGGVHRGASTSCTPSSCAALDAIPRIADEFATAFGRDSGGLVRGYRTEDAETVVVALGLGARHDRGRRRRAARRGRARSARSAITLLPPVSARRRSAPRSRGARRVVVVEKAFAVGAGGIVGQNVRAGAVGPRRSTSTTSSPGSAAGRSPRRRCAAARRRARGPARRRCTFLDLDDERRRARAGARATCAPGRTPRTSCAHRHRRGGIGEMPCQPIKFYQTGTFAVGNRLLDPEQRTVQARRAALEHAHLGPPRLPGLRRGARRPLRARRRDARDRRPADRGQRDRLPRGLLDAVPGELVAAAVAPLAVRQRARGRDRASPRR